MTDRAIYYTDELSDDFAATHGKIQAKEVGADYRYRHKNPIWRFFSFLLYRLVALPLGWLYLKLCFGLRIKNRRALRGLHGAYFLYGNHTQYAADAFLPAVIAFPHRASVITSADAVSIPIIRHLVAMLGGIPLSDTPRGRVLFLQTVRARAASGQPIAIYPEAHIWPYYNRIRPYSDASFCYPMQSGLPAVGFTVTYRRRKILRRLPPLITVTLSEPIFPTACADKREMRNRIYNFMCETVKRENSYAYREYRKKQDWGAEEQKTGDGLARESAKGEAK